MNSPMRSSSHGLQGPRPSPLAISPRGSVKIAKTKPRRPPVVVYLRSPKIIHVRPEEFRGLVQRLTGNRSSYSSSSTDHDFNNNVGEKRVVGGDDEKKLNRADYNNIEAANFGGPTRIIACSPSNSSAFGGEYSIITAFDIPMC